MIGSIAHGAAGFRPEASPAATSAPRAHAGFAERFLAWLHRRDVAALSREMDPRMARDMGATPASDRGPDGFAIDPRPFWGVGLTPRPPGTTPPWSGDRHHG